MRIIAGQAKGVRLKTVKGLHVRPTADRVKESIFNILENLNLPNHAIDQAKVLDVFAGTGNLGLEALSRGAREVVFVEKSAASLAVIRENIITVKMPRLCQVIKGDAFAVLAKLNKEGQTFNLAFADPPYDEGLAGRIVETFEGNFLLEDGALLLIEHSKGEMIDRKLKNLTFLRSQQYGQTMVSFFVKNTQECLGG
jgi:16S rRNA (guanine(966)-N(2))-methyltransferase RsmD